MQCYSVSFNFVAIICSFNLLLGLIFTGEVYFITFLATLISFTKLSKWCHILSYIPVLSDTSMGLLWYLFCSTYSFPNIPAAYKTTICQYLLNHFVVSSVYIEVYLKCCCCCWLVSFLKYLNHFLIKLELLTSLFPFFLTLSLVECYSVVLVDYNAKSKY